VTTRPGEFRHGLGEAARYRLLSTGGTRSLLAEGPAGDRSEPAHGVPGNHGGTASKTLHPKIHGGLLCRRDKPDHLAQAEKNQIALIDLVVVNLLSLRADGREAARRV